VEEEVYRILELNLLLLTVTVAVVVVALAATAQQPVVVVAPGLKHLWVTAPTQTIFGTKVLLTVIIHLIIVIKYLLLTDQTLVVVV
jgi:hypothetical protein